MFNNADLTERIMAMGESHILVRSTGLTFAVRRTAKNAIMGACSGTGDY